MKKITRFSEKITFHFSRLHSQILLNNCRFSDFSQVIQHIFNLGKIRKVQKVASFDLRKRVIFLDALASLETTHVSDSVSQ